MPSIPPKMPSRRPAAFMSEDELIEQLNVRLEQVDAVLETLAATLAKGESPGDLFARLHQAAVRDGRLADLAFAYEQATRHRQPPRFLPTAPLEEA